MSLVALKKRRLVASIVRDTNSRAVQVDLVSGYVFVDTEQPSKRFEDAAKAYRGTVAQNIIKSSLLYSDAQYDEETRTLRVRRAGSLQWFDVAADVNFEDAHRHAKENYFCDVPIPLIDTGDIVREKYSGDALMVSRADYVRGKLSWLGWPPGLGSIENYTLVSKASKAGKLSTLTDLAKSTHHDADWAKHTLAVLSGIY